MQNLWVMIRLLIKLYSSCKRRVAREIIDIGTVYTFKTKSK